MKTTSSQPHGRREFLKKAAVTGGAVTVAGAAAATAARHRWSRLRPRSWRPRRNPVATA